MNINFKTYFFHQVFLKLKNHLNSPGLSALSVIQVEYLSMLATELEVIKGDFLFFIYIMLRKMPVH